MKAIDLIFNVIIIIIIIISIIIIIIGQMFKIKK